MSNVPQTPITVLFWNVWNVNQMMSWRHKLVPERLDALIGEYNPDVIGLNEVMATDETGKTGLLIQYLESAGYHVNYASFGPETRRLHSGSVLASRRPAQDVRVEPIGPNLAHMVWGRGRGDTLKAIYGKIPLDNGGHVNIVVSHLSHLVPYNWGIHILHNRALRKILNEQGLKTRTIMGGDFNEFKFMSDMWHKKEGFHRATGTFLRPTWMVAGKYRILQANYDNIYWSGCGNVELQKFNMLNSYPSDHSPLVATFLVGPEEEPTTKKKQPK